MRELKATELNEVSGAGWIADLGALMGQSIGQIAGKGDQNAANAGAGLGYSIGGIIEGAMNTISSIINGIFGRK